MSDHPQNRRIDRILDPAFVDGLGSLSLEDVRARRDDCLAEREHLSLLRRLLQGRADISAADKQLILSGNAQRLLGGLA